VWSTVRAEPVAAPGTAAAQSEVDLVELDAECRRLASMRRGWDELFGHLAMLLRDLGLWRDMKFVSFAQYVAERLGMAPSTVNQHLARAQVEELPALPGGDARRARLLREGSPRRPAGDRGRPGELARASRDRALRRDLDALEQRQMCARRELDLRVARRVAVLLAAAMRATRAASDTWLTPSQCLERIARHFGATWAALVKTRITLRAACSSATAGARSRGAAGPPSTPTTSASGRRAEATTWATSPGSAPPSAARHLIAIHRGYIRVHGTAPGALT